MGYLSVNFILLLFACVAQCNLSLDKKWTRISTLDTQQRLNRIHTATSKRNQNVLIGSNTTRADLHQCIAECTFHQSFSASLSLPSNCSRRVRSYACIVEIFLSYNLENYKIEFLTLGNENAINNTVFTSSVMQTVTVFHNNANTFWYTMDFQCYTGDECDWKYVRQVIDTFVAVNFQPLYNALVPILFNSVGNNVSQCYDTDNRTNCMNGTCLSSFDAVGSSERACILGITPVLGIDIYFNRFFPGPTASDEDYITYTCNRDLCNSPSTDSSIQLIVKNYTSLLNVIQPSGGVNSIFKFSINIIWNIVSIFLTTMIWLILM